jgi:hypothetical protein
MQRLYLDLLANGKRRIVTRRVGNVSTVFAADDGDWIMLERLCVAACVIVAVIWWLRLEVFHLTKHWDWLVVRVDDALQLQTLFNLFFKHGQHLWWICWIDDDGFFGLVVGHEVCVYKGSI